MSHPMAEQVTMYRIHSWKNEIEAVEVVKKTEHFVTYLDKTWDRPRECRVKHEGRYFPTWDQAYVTLLDKQRAKVEAAKDQLQRARSELGKIESMRKPT